MLISKKYILKYGCQIRSISKTLFFGEDGRERLLKGIEKVTKAVEVTLGPKGRTVIIDHIFGHPQVTKDGFTVAKAISLEDRVENLGCAIAKSAAERTNWDAGDGTTAAMILTRHIFKEGCRGINGGIRSNALKEGIDLAVREITEELRKMSILLDNNNKEADDMLARVATVAANGDKLIGNLVAFTVKKIGSDGYISVNILSIQAN